jgi:hypothetical protein
VTSLVDTSLVIKGLRIEAGEPIFASIPPGASHVIDAAHIVTTTAAIVVLLFQEVLEGYITTSHNL